jgi:hypothetical protein
MTPSRSLADARPAAVSGAGVAAGGDAVTARGVDALLDAAAVALAAWTFADDLARLASHSATLALVVWAVLLVPGALLVGALHRGRAAAAGGCLLGAAVVPRRRVDVVLRVACLVCAGGAAALLAVPGGRVPAPWAAVWSLLAVAAVCGVAGAVRSRHQVRAVTDCAVAALAPASPRAWRRASLLLVLAVAAGLGTFSLFVNRPDADDVYYVNRAQWVADHGTLPSGDTIFADQAYPALERPEVSSYEALVGSLAYAVRRPAGDLAYEVVPLLGTFLAVLALWSLLSAWRVPMPLVALAVALLFLLMGGAQHTSFGNLFLGRMWQGKVLFLAVVVPLLLARLTEWSRAPTWPRLVLLGLLGVAAVGLSSTAVLVVPLVGLAGSAPLALRRRRPALLGYAAVIAYPVAAAVLIRVDRGGAGVTELGNGTTDPGRTLAQVLGHDALTALAVLALLVGWMALRRWEGRVAASVTALLLVALLAPGVLGLLGDRLVTGLSDILWRLFWMAPVAALVGAATTLLAAWRRGGLVRYLPPVAAAALIVGAGVPIWAASNHAQLTAAPGWKLDAAALAEARIIAAHGVAGGTVLAPVDVGLALSVLTTRMHAVDPRRAYLADVDDPRFHRAQRQLLTDFADDRVGAGAAAPIAAALRAVDVRLACVDSGADVAALTGAGYSWVLRAGPLQCYAPAA